MKHESLKRLANWISGKKMAPTGACYLEKRDPATGEVIYEIPDSSEVDVVAAIAAAQKAFASWRVVDAVSRAQILLRIADLIEARREELAQAESRDTGKPLHLARSLDIPRAALNFRFFGTKILHKQEICTDMDGQALNYVLRQPVGVAGLITPWNLPLYLLSWKVAPALSVGNVVVCKPSELTPMTASLLCEIAEEAGLPPGVLNVVHGRGDPCGALLCSHPGVPLISFTGGTETGERVLKACAPHFKKVSLELGGKNATIVLKDANLDKAIPIIVRSSFLNQGEICLCGSRILVAEEIVEVFTSRFVEEVKALKVGPPHLADTFMGPLISAAHRDKVVAFIELAKKEAGKILCGGNTTELSAPHSNGFYLNPTVVRDLTQCSEIHQSEVFGPFVTINSFKYPHEAVKWANNTPYGLSCSLWTQDVSKAHKIAGQIQAATIWVNTWLKRDLRVPFGGMKASGLGREGGEDSIDFFTEKKTICVDLT